MKKINFTKDIAPHAVAALVFMLVTMLFFNPIFFDHKVIEQHDIQQFKGSSKSITDYREATGSEALWAPSMFSGMPAYLVSLRWSDGPVVWVKKIMSVFLPHPINNIYVAFLCYYILLLSFRVRPYLAIAGALAFGLSSYVIIGLGAGHNARIGAIAFMPLVMAGIHLAFTKKRLLGFAVTALGLALHLRENHLQITYYLILIVIGYGLVQLIYAYHEKQLKDFAINLVILIPASVIAAGTFFGQFWAITEYTKYSIRGPSELTKPNAEPAKDGLSKSYAFEYSNGILEPMTLIIPDFYGGSSSTFFVMDQQSNTYQALVNSGDNQTANQLANYTSAYWGSQSATAPYYAGAIIVFLFVLGVLLAEKKWLWWLLPLSVLGIVLSWGENFSSFNYLMFDYFPGYNKFRSVTFALIIILFAMPLLGLLGLEKFLETGDNKETKKKLLIALAATGGLCLAIFLFSGMIGFLREGESQLPAWFVKALQTDRRSLLRADALRSFGFILPVFVVLYFNLNKRISEIGFYAFLIFLVAMDLSRVDKRYFTKDKFQRKNENAFFALSGADEAVLKDKGYYRVYNLQESWSQSARASYYHHSLGGYHGAKLRRYQDLYDSCLSKETRKFYLDAQQNKIDFTDYSVLNMLNTKYIMYGPEATNILINPSADGNAWFVKEAAQVKSPAEELKKVGEVNTKNVAVIDVSKFQIPNFEFDSTSTITLQEFTPPYLKYESQSATDGLAVFSEIYYPKGWHAFIDGAETEILRADYVLRALKIPQGKHTIEFKFEPKPYTVGNKISFASSWLVVLLTVGCIGWSFKKKLILIFNT
ncbi:MAG: YfhO family protein [Bacteroidetes bacterium]|nr:YfhO family protein [Bacteroidota bacterium]